MSKRVTDLSLPEYKALMESVYHTAQAITDQFSPDKINYLIFGDTSTHLHVHIVPKYQNGKDWGKVFLTDEPEPLFLEEDAYQSICADLCRRLGLN